MTYIVHTFTTTFEPIVVGVASDLNAAKALLRDGVFQLEEDADYPDCFDGITNRGEVFTIRPKQSS